MALAILALAAGCGETRRATQLPLEAAASRIDVFVRAVDTGGRSLVMELDSVQARDDSGELRALTLRRPTVRSDETTRRVTLAGSIVPPGSYDALVLRVRAAWSERPEGRLQLQLAPAELPEELTPEESPEPQDVLELVIDMPVVVRQREAVSVFLDWNVAASLLGETRFRPVFGAVFEARRAQLGLLAVADASAGSVLTVDPGSGQVIGTSKAGGEPLRLALTRDRRQLCVANAGEGSVTIIDLRQNLPNVNLPVRFAARTSDVVVIDDARLVAACNRSLDSVSLFSLGVYARLPDIQVGRGPVRMALAPGVRRLFVANAGSDDLSVIDVETLSVVAEIKVESQPSDVALDRRGEQVFVGHRTSPTLLVLDALDLGVDQRILVGAGVTALLADRRRDLLYVARAVPAEIAVVDWRLGAVVRRIAVTDRIEGLAQPLQGGLLFGAAPGLGGLIVIDTVLGKELPLIPCGVSPVDVLTID